MIKYLEKTAGTVERLNYYKIYGQALNNKKLLILLMVILLGGFSVFGSFTFSGELIKQTTDLNILQIGLILSIFGISGIVGAKLVPKLRPLLGNSIVLSAGILGSISIFSLSTLNAIPFLILAISGYGITFICVHSIFVATAQTTIPKLRGTIMSLVSFSVFVGSGFGTVLYKRLMDSVGITSIFLIAAIVFLVIGISGFIILNVLQNKIGNLRKTEIILPEHINRASTVIVTQKRKNDNISARYGLNEIQCSAYEIIGLNRRSGCAWEA
jgi:predicted MFS family arabinose efflux permease